MIEALREALAQDDRIAFALLFGSTARGSAGAGSDVDVAIGLRRGAMLDALAIGDLASRLEAAAGRPVDVVLLDEAPSPLAYRAFRDGQLILEKDHAALAERKARAILEYLDFRPVEEMCAGTCCGPRSMVDKGVLADAGSDVPQSYRDVFESLARRSVIPGDLAARLAAASGFRNLIAHQYGALDPARVHQIARFHLGELLEFCAEIARRADAQG
jgi:predicted nucleotidyltransferase